MRALHTQSRKELLALWFSVLCVSKRTQRYDGFSLLCPLTSTHMNTDNQGGGGVLLKAGTPLAILGYFILQKGTSFSWRIQDQKPVCSNHDLTDQF